MVKLSILIPCRTLPNRDIRMRGCKTYRYIDIIHVHKWPTAFRGNYVINVDEILQKFLPLNHFAQLCTMPN